jgi:uncharacterized phage-associated protein
MNFPVDGRKSTDAVARLIEKSGSKVDYLRICKLIYLADRKSIVERGVPIVGGKYFSMRKGPTIGEIMGFVNSRNAPFWKEYIQARRGNSLSLRAVPGYGTLSSSEMEILDSVVQEHSQMSTEKLVEWCHDHCSEYQRVIFGRKNISVESILKAEGKSEEKIERIVKEAESTARLDALLS